MLCSLLRIHKNSRLLMRSFSILDKRVDIFVSHYNNIHFNLATEEYLYEHSDLKYPTLFLYRNDKTVVIGNE